MPSRPQLHSQALSSNVSKSAVSRESIRLWLTFAGPKRPPALSLTSNELESIQPDRFGT